MIYKIIGELNKDNSYKEIIEMLSIFDTSCKIPEYS
jgi:hypothetical protein